MDHIEHMNRIQLGLSSSTEQIKNSSDCLIRFYKNFLSNIKFFSIGGNNLFSPDLPITKSTEDKLNRGAFAKSLAKTILQYSSPSSFTIGLYGEWGSGKTSLVNMVLEAIEDIDSSAIV